MPGIQGQGGGGYGQRGSRLLAWVYVASVDLYAFHRLEVHVPVDKERLLREDVPNPIQFTKGERINKIICV